MRISSKGRYGLAAMIALAQNDNLDECVTIAAIAEKLGISKIYLEQVFSLLKRAALVQSVKGAQGGYKLAKAKENISICEIMKAIEIGLFEKAEASVTKNQEAIENALIELVWKPLDEGITETLSSIFLSQLVDKASLNKKGHDFMFYI